MNRNNNTLWKTETEIFGTFGPACCTADVIERMIRNGMTGIRLNLSHGPLKSCETWIDALHEAEDRTGKKICFLIDLKGRELRTGKMEERWFENEEILILGKDIPVDDGILPLLQVGDRILIDDGAVHLLVLKETENGWYCSVLQEGQVSSSKSLKIEGKYSKKDSLCPEDLENLDLAGRYGVDAVMVPFVESAEDLNAIRKAIENRGLNLRIYAKIENRIGALNVPEIGPLCDTIVIARGDLGNDTGLTGLPVIQAELEKICAQYSFPYMIVTQLLTSMISHPVCTRAEANDVFNAVRNGASSLMVTNETATGLYPDRVIDVLTRLASTGREYARSQKQMI